jgi:hypothetical protein
MMIAVNYIGGSPADVNRVLGIPCITGKIVTDSFAQINSFDQRVMSTYQLACHVADALLSLGLVCNGTGYNRKKTRTDIFIVNSTALLVEKPAKDRMIVHHGDKKYKITFKGSRQMAAQVMEKFLICKALGEIGMQVMEYVL